MWFYFPDTLGKPLEEVAAIFGDHDEVAGYMADIEVTDEEVERAGAGAFDSDDKPRKSSWGGHDVQVEKVSADKTS